MSIDEMIFRRLPKESDEDYATRVTGLERTFRNVLATMEGHQLMALLTAAVNPVLPRFSAGVSAEMAAFRDGQADVIATLLVRGTNLGISKPTN